MVLAMLTAAAVSVVARPARTTQSSGLLALYDFRRSRQKWKPTTQNGSCRPVNDINGDEKHALRIAGPESGSGESSPRAPLAGAGIKLPPGKRDWHMFTHLLLRLYVPKDAPPKTQAIVYLKDSGLNYYQHLRKKYLEPGSWTNLRIDLTADSGMWSFRRHYKPWDGYCRQNVQEMGVKFIGPHEFRGPYYLGSVELTTEPGTVTEDNAIYHLRSNDNTIGRFEKFELSFNLARTYSNPFDPDVVRVTGHFIRPDNTEVTVPGFFYQGYLRRMDKGAEKLVPKGRSQWKVRFAPQQVGPYHYFVEVHDAETGESAPLRSEMNRFECVESDKSGFVRVSDDDRFCFELDDDSFYYPIGHNIASVHDARARTLQVNIPASEGTYAYDRILSRMSEAGENWGRIWMSPWSFGIEWTQAYDRHYRGRGRYNLHNAWRLDHVLRTAETNAIRVLLLFTAHGEIGDYESDFWGHDPQKKQGHPYWSRYGGPADKPRDLYTSARARELYKKKIRYIVARWSYSRAIMAWEILNEADLASFYQNQEFGRTGADFVASVARHIRKLDPSDHLITSGVFRYRRPWSEPLLELNELDFNTGHIFQGNLERRLIHDVRYMQRRYDKIFLPTEAGLTPFAQDAETTALAIHRTLWSSFMVPAAGAAAPWWWVLIDRRDLYYHFAALSRFARGEDRRNQNYEPTDVEIEETSEAERPLQAIALGNDTDMFCWVYNEAAFSSRATWEAATEHAAKLTLYGLAAGRYNIEIWDTYRGKVIKNLTAESQAINDGEHESAMTLSLPPFARDIALKVKTR